MSDTAWWIVFFAGLALNLLACLWPMKDDPRETWTEASERWAQSFREESRARYEFEQSLWPMEGDE